MNDDYDFTKPVQSFLNKPIKRIAVCCYGQYRTGDYCLPIIKKFYEKTAIEVDFFCSLKAYTTYNNHRKWREKNNITDNNHMVFADTDYQTSQLKNHLHPRAIKIITIEEEENNKPHNPIEQGWISSIILKQQYEAEQNIVYDLVFMQRYDTLPWPFNLAELLVKGLSKIPLSDMNSIHTTDSDFIFADTINNKIQWPDNGVSSYFNVLQDTLIVGSSRALDVISYEFLNNVPNKNDNKNKKYLGWQTINYAYNIHHSLPAAIKANNISIYRFPLLSDSEIYFNERNSKGKRWPIAVVVREIEQMIEYDINTLDDNTKYEHIIRFYKKIGEIQR